MELHYIDEDTKKVLTAEQLLRQPHTLEVMVKELGDDIVMLCGWIEDFHAKSKNYSDGIYYHAHTYGLGGGVGDGLYMGKDKNALINFYIKVSIDEYDDYAVDIYNGYPTFLDLTNYLKWRKFKEDAKIEFPNEKDFNYIRKKSLSMGYDGIRYYDPLATGEEFVLYNVDKVKLVKTEKIVL